jgi:hypothetical protein
MCAMHILPGEGSQEDTFEEILLYRHLFAWLRSAANFGKTADPRKLSRQRSLWRSLIPQDPLGSGTLLLMPSRSFTARGRFGPE